MILQKIPCKKSFTSTRDYHRYLRVQTVKEFKEKYIIFTDDFYSRIPVRDFYDYYLELYGSGHHISDIRIFSKELNLDKIYRINDGTKYFVGLELRYEDYND